MLSLTPIRARLTLIQIQTLPILLLRMRLLTQETPKQLISLKDLTLILLPNKGLNTKMKLFHKVNLDKTRYQTQIHQQHQLKLQWITYPLT